MSGQLIGGVVGAAVGFFAGGPAGAKAGWVIGSMIGGVVDPNLPEIGDQLGPRLTDLNVVSSAYGMPIPIVYGSYRIAGNVIWSEEIKETKHVEDVEYGKGGGDSYEIVTYTYSITMALGLSAGITKGYRTIWADSVKIYDERNGGYTQLVLESEEKSGNITFYDGASDQKINWVLQAAEPDTPAYRNLCYIIFEDFQLQNFGNRIPNMTVELVSDGETDLISTVSYKIPTISNNKIIIPTVKQSNNVIDAYVLDNITDEIKVYSMSDRLDPWYDYSYTTNYNYNDIINSTIITNDNELYVEILGNTYVEIHNTKTGLVAVGPKHGGVYLGVSDYIVKSGNTFYAYYSTDTNIVLKLFNTTDPDYYIFDAGPIGKSIEIFNTTEYRDLYSVDQETIFTFSTIDNSIIEISNETIIHRDYSDLGVIFKNTPNNPLTHSYIRVNTSNDIYIFQWEADGKPKIYKISNIRNIYIGKITSVGSLKPENQMFNIYNDKYYIYNEEVVDNTYSVLNLFNIIFIPEGVTLDYIIEDIFKRTKLNEIDYDVTSGTDNIIGYCISRQMSGRAAISDLQSVYQFFIIENNYILTLIKLNTDIKEIFNSSDLVDELVIIKRLNTELPKKLTLKYPNEFIDYQTGAQSITRMDGSTEYNKIIETTAVLTDNESRRLVEELMYITWSGRETYNFKVPFNTNFKVSDSINIIQNNVMYTIRITQIVYGSALECVGISSNIYKIISNADGSDISEGFLPYIPQIQGPSKLLLFNAPTLDNSIINSLGSYYAATGHVDSWKGCNILKSTDNGITYRSIDAILSSNIIGFTTTKLLDGVTTLWDLQNEVTVHIYSGALYSEDEYSLLRSRANYIMIGNEVLQYTNATYNDDGTYTLSSLLRGRLGTEWATSTHTSKETFIFLDNSINFDTNSIGISNIYKAVTLGYELESAKSIDFAYDGTNIIPISPAYLYKRDNEITWHRRDRYITFNMYTKPYSETVEKYKLEFFNQNVSKGIVHIILGKEDQASYTYDGSYDPIDKLQISQYSSVLDDYGYITEELI